MKLITVASYQLLCQFTSILNVINYNLKLQSKSN